MAVGYVSGKTTIKNPNRVLPGGTHADGLTYNALVVLNDGVYLELIAFTHDVDYYSESTSSSSGVTPELSEKRKKHWWGYKSPGWINWANLGFGGEKMADIVMNANSDGGVVADGGSGDVKYLAPVEGGRTKPDGDVLQWRVDLSGLGSSWKRSFTLLLRGFDP